jgi:Zn-dependent M28 family amino/carboxypeptidase
VAHVLSESGDKPRRSILFVSFSGEEQGLLGSRLYVGHPAVPLERTVGMINVDHAGIGNGRLTVGVTGLSKEKAAEAGRLGDVTERLDLFGFFPGGDHVPFKEAGIPTVTVVSGGPHPNFHQPSDTAEAIKPDILRMAARYVLAVAWLLANGE